MAQPSDLPPKDLKAKEKAEVERVFDESDEAAATVKFEADLNASSPLDIEPNSTEEDKLLREIATGDPEFESDQTDEAQIEEAAQSIIAFEEEAKANDPNFETIDDTEAREAVLETAMRGEFFIRAAVAHDICARAMYRGISLAQAADEVILQKLTEMGGTGGIVGMDQHGNAVFSFNTAGMYRGSMGSDGVVQTAIYE